MKRSANVLALGFALSLASSHLTWAAAIDYTDRTAWESAAGAAATLADDFDDVTSDIHFSGGSIARTGYSVAGGYRLEATPFLAVASSPMSANGTSGITHNGDLVFTLDEATQTFGADWACGGGSSNWTISYATDGGDSGSFNLPSQSNTGEFRGIISDTPFTVMTFSVSAGCWAFTDNVAAHTGVVANDAPTWGGIKALFR